MYCKILSGVLLIIIAAKSFAQPVNNLRKMITNPDGKSLLMLGIHNQKGYETIVFFHENGASKVVSRLPYLLSPQKDGFFYINERRFSNIILRGQSEEIKEVNRTYFCTTEKALLDSLTKREPKTNKVRCKDCTDHFYDSSRKVINYIIPGFICFSHSSHTFEGGKDYTPDLHINTRKIKRLENMTIQSNFLHSGIDGEITVKEPNWTIQPSSLLYHSFKLDVKKWKQTLYAISYNSGDGRPFDEKIPHKEAFIYDSLDKYFNTKHSKGSNISSSDWDFRPDLLHISYELDHYLGVTQLFVIAYQGSPPYGLLEIEAGALTKNYGPYNYAPVGNTLKVHMRQTGDDVFASPGNDVIYYLKNLANEQDPLVYNLIHPSANNLIKDISSKWHYTVKGDIVMAEWAIGDDIDLWLKVIDENSIH